MKTQFKHKVLIVDDFAMARMLVRNALAPFNIEMIHTATNGQEALEKIRQAANEGKPFSLVFTDVNMPEMSGLQLLEACRADEKTKALNFIVITAQGEKQNALTALASGATDYITKPFESGDFEKKVSRILNLVGTRETA